MCLLGGCCWVSVGHRSGCIYPTLRSLQCNRYIAYKSELGGKMLRKLFGRRQGEWEFSSFRSLCFFFVHSLFGVFSCVYANMLRLSIIHEKMIID